MSIGPVTPVGAPGTSARSLVGSERRPAAEEEAQTRAAQADRVELSSSARKSTEPAKLRLSMAELRALISAPVEPSPPKPKSKSPETDAAAAKAAADAAPREMRRAEEPRPAPTPPAARAEIPKTSDTGALPLEVKTSTRPADTKSRS